METSIERLESILAKSASDLDIASEMVRDLDFNKESNIKKIGECLVNLFEIQHEIYKIRPDLKPDFLND